MRVSTFIGLVALFALIGLCVVRETNRQAAARYTLAELQQREIAALARLDELEVQVARLSQTERLERLNQRRALGLVPLRSAAADARP